MGAYDAIELRPTWGGLSLLTFGLVVGFLSLVALVARMVLGFHVWSVILWLVLPSLSLLGSLFAAAGLLLPSADSGAATGSVLPTLRRSPAALAGLVLNGTVLLSCLAALIWPW